MVKCDLNAVWAAIRTAMVDDTTWCTTWTNLTLYTQQCRIYPYMWSLSKSLKQTYLIAFVAQV
jgi:hypothetical protein